MSSSGKSRSAWTCPECSRTFRIPKSKSQPRVCPKCARKESASNADPQAKSDDGDEMYFQEAEPSSKSSLKFGVVAQPVSAGSKEALPTTNENEPRIDGSSTSIDELSDRVDQILEHLEGISRTMKLVRWVVWGLAAATVLSVVVTAGGVLYSMSMIGSLGDLLNAPAGDFAIDEVPVGGGAEVAPVGNGGDRNAQIPPQLREKLKPIQDYSNQLNELLEEVNQ